jgi:hypothetical protein
MVDSMSPLRATLAATVAAVCLVRHVACPPRLPAADDAVRAADAPETDDADAQAGLVDLAANFDANLFDQPGGGWVFRAGVVRPVGGPGGPGEDPGIDRIRRAAHERLDRIDRLCGLSPEQRRKLELALESDIRRFAAEVAQTRSRYETATVNMRDRAGQERWRLFQQDVQRCRRRMQRLLDDGSLFAGVLGSVLDEGQRAQLTAERAARRTFRWRWLVSGELEKLDDILALTQEQHDVVEKLLLAREPELVIDAPPRPRNPQAEQMLVRLVLSQVDLQPLQAALQPDQLRKLRTLANQGRAMQSWLEEQGLVERRGQ